MADKPSLSPPAPPAPATAPVPAADSGLVQTWKGVQNMQAIGKAEGAYVGRLEDFQFDLETHRIYGWRLKGTGYFGKSGGVAARHLELLGRDLALLDSERSVEWSPTSRRNPDGRAWASNYRGTQAITRRGLSLGAVQDFVLAADGSRVTGIILHGDRLLPLDERVHCGPAAVIAVDEKLLVDLGDGDHEPEGPTWWARLKDAISSLSPQEETRAEPLDLPVDIKPQVDFARLDPEE